MFVVTAVVCVLLAVALVGSGAGKILRAPAIMTSMEQVRVPPARVPLLGVVEIVGAVGLLVGLALAPLGVAAAVGVVLCFVGAVIAHVRVGDRDLAPAAALGLVALAALVLRTATA